MRKRRINYFGKYAGNTAVYIALLVNDTKGRVKRRLNAFYRRPENQGKEGDPATLGRFIFTYLLEERNRSPST